MKRFVILALLFTALSAFAQAPEDVYLRIYPLIQQGETFQQTGQPAAAILKYTEAQASLKSLQNSHPTWNSSLVKFRIEDLGEKLEKLGKLVATTPASKAKPAGQNASTNTTTPLTDEQMTALNQEINRLRAENQMLESKLKEAFAVQPATVSPRDMAKAETRIVELQKESDLLKVALEQQQQQHTKEVPKKTVEAVVPDEKAVAKEDAKIKALLADRDDLEKKLKEARRLIDSQKEALAEKSKLEKKLTDAEVDRKGLEDRLSQANKSLESLKSKSSDENKNVKRDQEKTDALNKQKEELGAKLTAANKEIDQLKSTLERNDKSSSADQRRLKDLTKSNGELTAKLDLLKNDLKEVRSKSSRTDDQQVAVMKSKLAVYEARPAPFTPEELALFRKPEQQIAEAAKAVPAPKSPTANTANLTPVSNTEPKSTEAKSDVVKKPKKTNRELPAGAGALAADAERAFAQRRFEDAEKKYLEVLAQDPLNVYTLGNLSAIELELNQIEKAEKYLKTALEQDPEDSFSLTLLGELRFRQEKFDEALDLLSKSADLNPKSAETQNYLGITLSQKGQRIPAEAALRKAIQLQPDYASAHHNLALVYATQKPPFIELARYHYQKSLVLGHPKNPDLEKMIEVK
ncbi:MAG: Tetratricopeptide 2 repeat protein [Verrucomicrobiales bacterium]|nr:Tetratricopeptide 2 repeat protein [Verrucomicrobiales bacterium]